MTTRPPLVVDHGLRFRPDIEGLRAVAILFVVLFHAGWTRAGGGYLGVDVFFVLSGFLITGICVQEISETGTLSLVNFWARRARRLLPAAAFVTLVVLVANAYLLSPFAQTRRAETVRAFALYGSNISFAIGATDYFGSAATRDPLLHTWSLSVEEQFYVLFAPLLLLLAARTRRFGHAAFRRRLAILTAVLSVVSIAGCLFLVRQRPVIAFYILPTRAWEFGLGALALLAVGRIARARRLVLELVSLTSMAALLWSTVYLREGRFPPIGLASLVPTLGTVGLILAGAGAQATFVGRALSTAPLRLLGRLSYSWYLWHWPVLVYLRELVPQPSLTLSLGAAAASLVPAAVTYALVESPVRFSSFLQRQARAVVAGAIVLAAATYVAGAFGTRHAGTVLEEPRFAAMMAARELSLVYTDGCHVPIPATASPSCQYGPARNDTTVVLFGDSHAAQWFPAMDSLVALRGWRLVSLTKSGCPSVWVDVPNKGLGRAYTECESWRRSSVERVVKLHPTIVVISNSRQYSVNILGGVYLTDSSGLARREWYDGLVRTLRALGSSGARIIVLEDSPQPQYDIPVCLVRYIKDQSRCRVDIRRALSPAMVSSERTAAASVPGVAYITLGRYICDATACPAQGNGLVRYRDNDHLAMRFSRTLAPQLSDALTGALVAARAAPTR